MTDEQVLTAAALCAASYSPDLPDGAIPFFLPYPAWIPRALAALKGAPTGPERIGFLLKGDGFYWRVWKGSTSPFDWLMDFLCAPTNFGVHSGFAQVYADAMPSMVEALNQIPPGVPVVDTGHSLGGALAEIAYACDPNPPADGAITFAAPRVFTATRCATLPKAGIRIVNERDLVPHLPGANGVWEFSHRPPAERFTATGPFDVKLEHSITESYQPALAGEFGPLQGPMELR